MNPLLIKILTLIFLCVPAFSLVGCLDEPPAAPPRNNPWDPLNPTAPRAPDRFRAYAISETDVLLSWRDRSGNEDGFRIYEEISDSSGLRPVAVTAADTDSLILHNRLRQQVLWYDIESFNAYGSSYLSNRVLVSTLNAPPLPPVNLTGTSTADSTVSLSWADSSRIEAGFEIEQGLGIPDNFILIATTPADCTAWQIESLNPGPAYYFRVRAVNPYGHSPFTNPIEIRLP